MKSLETAYILATAVAFTLSALSAAILGKKSQIPPLMFVVVSFIAAAGWIIFFNR